MAATSLGVNAYFVLFLQVRAGLDERGSASDHILLSSCPRLEYSRGSRVLPGVPAQNKKRRRVTIRTLGEYSIGIRTGREDAL